LDEKRRWDGGLLATSVLPTIKAASTAQSEASTAKSASSSKVDLDPVAPKARQPIQPPASPWKHFQPSSPSPLSPAHHKPRSPRPHVAGKRKAPKTPLARLVLEKAVRQREKESSSQSSSGSSNGNVFGAESTRRTNVAPLGTGADGKERNKSKMDLKASTRLGQSVGPGVKRDLSKSDGVGPKAAALKAGKTWR
jgi:hypothetical protein